MKQSKYSWEKINILEKQDYLLTNYLNKNHLPAVLKPILAKQHFKSEEEIQQFLYPTLDDLFDPFLMHDMDKAVLRIKEAILKNEQILIYGDYDCDGITSTTVMKEAIEALGGEPKFYLPNRFTDGYGPNLEVYKYFIESGIDLIITVDNGIAGFKALQYAKEQGVDVIVTDHHEIQEQLPKAFAIVHPRHPESNYPFQDLAGVGVAFKVATALLETIPTEMLDLVALGTIADLVSITSENRILVKYGLEVAKNTSRIGLQDLAKVANCDLNKLTSEQISFNFAPRLNALGRLQDATPGVELLTTFDELEAKNIAKEIEETNSKRKDIVNEIIDEAVSKIETDQNINILYSSNWHEGVLGIVASKVVELTNRPAIILTHDKKTNRLKGSGRSIEAINLANILNNCKDLLLTYGGHHMAVGLSLTLENFSTFKIQMNQLITEKLSNISELRPICEVDLQISSSEIDKNLLETFDLLEPFGTDNPKPIIQINNPEIFQTQKIGQNKKHLKAKLLTKNQESIDLLAFNFEESKRTFLSSNNLKIIGELGLNCWRGTETIQFLLKDYKIEGLQLFDGRNQHFMQEDFMSTTSQFLYFQEENFKTLSKMLPSKEIKHVNDLNCKFEQFILLDQPEKEEELFKILKENNQKTFVLVLSNPTLALQIPTREEFTKLFKFIKQYQQYDIRHQLNNLAKTLQINPRLLILMLQVFEELNFISIDNGIMKPIQNPVKKSLSESKILQNHKNKIELYHNLMTVPIEKFFLN